MTLSHSSERFVIASLNETARIWRFSRREWRSLMLDVNQRDGRPTLFPSDAAGPGATSGSASMLGSSAAQLGALGLGGADVNASSINGYSFRERPLPGARGGDAPACVHSRLERGRHAAAPLRPFRALELLPAICRIIQMPTERRAASVFKRINVKRTSTVRSRPHVRHARRVLGAHTPAPPCVHFCVYSGHLFNSLFSVSGFAFGSGPDSDSVSVGAFAMRHNAGKGGKREQRRRREAQNRLQRGSSHEGHRVLRVSYSTDLS